MSKITRWRSVAGLLLSLGLLALAAAPAHSLETLSLEAAAAGEAEDACAALTRVKYPWSSCGSGFALGFDEGAYGEPPDSECRLFMRNGVCASTTHPWFAYLGLRSFIEPLEP